jgi:hypothetical protein
MRRAMAHHRPNHKLRVHTPTPVPRITCSLFRNNISFPRTTSTRLSNNSPWCLARLATHMIAAALPPHSTATILANPMGRRTLINRRTRTRAAHHRTTMLGITRMDTGTMMTGTIPATSVKGTRMHIRMDIRMQRPSRLKDTATGTGMRWPGTKRTRIWSEDRRWEAV